MAKRRVFRWASDTRAHGMPTPEALERRGYRRLHQHPRVRSQWLMERRA